jgi:UDP-N-acetylglucosamine:LPS N-acetylglucosamine transferase
LIAEPELNPDRLTKEIFTFLDQPGEIAKLATKARSLAHPYAVREIVDLIEEAASQLGQAPRGSGQASRKEIRGA